MCGETITKTKAARSFCETQIISDQKFKHSKTSAKPPKIRNPTVFLLELSGKFWVVAPKTFTFDYSVCVWFTDQRLHHQPEK
jgi:hypothetical protein